MNEPEFLPMKAWPGATCGRCGYGIRAGDEGYFKRPHPTTGRSRDAEWRCSLCMLNPDQDPREARAIVGLYH